MFFVKRKKNINFFLQFLVIFLPSIFGFIIIFFKKSPFYTNGLDEATYLSWGTAKITNELGLANYYLYVAKYIAFLGHNLNLSATKINILCDSLTSFLILILAKRVMKVVSLPFNQILIITIIFIYSSSIFSGANPVEYFYNFFDHTKIFVAINSSYPFLFRTPNPQFSVFLILVQIFLYLSKNQILKRISFIFIPIFLIFSYPFLKIGYFIFLLSILIIKSQKFKSFFSKSLLILITYLISSLSIWLAILYIKNYNLEFYNDLLISHRFLDNFHTPKFALFSLFSFFIYILSLIIFYRFKKNKLIYQREKRILCDLRDINLCLQLAALFTSNLQIINGINFFPEFIDNGSIVWSSFSLTLSYLLIYKINSLMKFSGSKIILMMMKSFSLSCLLLGFCIYGFTFWRGLKFSDISYESNLFSNYSKDSELPLTIHQNKNYESDLYTRISAATITKKYPILFSAMYKFPFYGKQDKEEIIYRHLKEYKKYKYLKNHDEQISQEMFEIIGQIIYSYHWKNSSSQRQEINYLLSTIE